MDATSTTNDKISSPGEILNGTHYIMRGPAEGDIVLCMHGTGYDSYCFESLSIFLANAGYRVIAYDQIGRGYSANDSTEKFGPEEHLRQISNLLSGLGLESKTIHVIGHSMGGSLATLFVSANPAKVKSLTLLSPAGLLDAGALKVLRSFACIRMMAKSGRKSKLEASWRGEFFNHTGDFLQIENDFFNHLKSIYDSNPAAFNNFWNTLMQFPLSGIDSQIQAIASKPQLSVFLLWGQNDASIPMKPNFARWDNYLKNGSCNYASKIVENSKHCFFMEYPEICNLAIAEFLSKASNSTAKECG